MISRLNGGGADGIIILPAGGSRGGRHDGLGGNARSRDNFMISILGLRGEGGGNTKIGGCKRRRGWWLMGIGCGKNLCVAGQVLSLPTGLDWVDDFLLSPYRRRRGGAGSDS